MCAQTKAGAAIIGLALLAILIYNSPVASDKIYGGRYEI